MQIWWNLEEMDMELKLKRRHIVWNSKIEFYDLIKITIYRNEIRIEKLKLWT